MTRNGLALNPEDPPILVCADLQAQYLGDDCAGGREVSQCLALIALWRAELWPVLHLKRIRAGRVVRSFIEADRLGRAIPPAAR
jgi:hypothetical protein